MDREKCKNCKWRVVMSYTDGRVFRADDIMCHYNWKEIQFVRPEECHFKAKRERNSEEVTE